MRTSSFRIAGKHPSAVAICVGVPKWYKGKKYPALAPTRAMLKMERHSYGVEYEMILGMLDAKKVCKDLGEDAVLLCWERPGERCHRRRVAEWIEEHTGMKVRELETNWRKHVGMYTLV